MIMNKDRLQQYRYIRREILRLKHRQEGLRRHAGRAVRSPDKTPVKGGQWDIYPEIMDKIIALDATIAARLCDLYSEEAAIEKAIAALDSRGRLLMRYRYLDGLTLEETAEKLGYEYAYARRMHGNYLRELKNEQ